MQINTTIGFVKEVPETYEDPSFWRAWYSLNIAMKIEVNVSERKQGWFFFFFFKYFITFFDILQRNMYHEQQIYEVIQT